VAYAATALALAASLVVFATMWLSQRAISDAVHTWTTHPAAAYAELQRASRLEPLSDQAQLLAGTIASRGGDYARAKTQFSAALSRFPQDAYATLVLGALDSATGQPAQAAQLLARAVSLAPRDPIARAALTLVRRGGTVDPAKLGQAIYRVGALLAG
jgi:tetratricopeptide (TPR) repeat protein